MKLHYFKILLFFLPLNILVTSYKAHNNNKPSITPCHRPIYTSRVLSECDIESSNYNNDTDMKSVKESFDRQTSQRFQEYEKRMKNKRQKLKEERDKNIEKIIEKDKMVKSLEEKIEKGCLRCGCGLGGVAASVGLFGGLGMYGWKSSATTAAIEGVKQASIEAGEAARIPAAIDAVIEGIKNEFGVSILDAKELVSYITPNTYPNVSLISEKVYFQYQSKCIPLSSGVDLSNPICISVAQKSEAAKEIPEMLQGKAVSHMKVINKTVENIVLESEHVAETAAKRATAEAIKASTDAVESTYASCQTAIIASVVAIIIIALVMIIIYLVLRYRRKKKMNKKAQYTKLLNQ
ncbi:rifin [Plasmodium reichenowi]|uniref:Rifin n=1 Tax=Plasmodium reichenowi TaxID=5854 RepID=A0A060RQ09_PLARE|nr:rifin [Plasmodium reichenowi]